LDATLTQRQTASQVNLCLLAEHRSASALADWRASNADLPRRATVR